MAVRRELDVAPLAAAVPLGPAAGRSLDVGGIAERREQRPVRAGRLVLCGGARLCKSRSAKRQQDDRADCLQGRSPLPPLPPHQTGFPCRQQCAAIVPGERFRHGARCLVLLDNGDDDDQNHTAHPGRQPEPQGPRQRAPHSHRHHQGPSRRREEQHPRAGRSRQHDAEHKQPALGVRKGLILDVVPANAGIHTA